MNSAMILCNVLAFENRAINVLWKREFVPGELQHVISICDGAARRGRDTIQAHLSLYLAGFHPSI